MKLIVHCRYGRVFGVSSGVQPVVSQQPTDRRPLLVRRRLSAGPRPATLCGGVVALEDVEVFHGAAVLHAVWQGHSCERATRRRQRSASLSRHWSRVGTRYCRRVGSSNYCSVHRFTSPPRVAQTAANCSQRVNVTFCMCVEIFLSVCPRAYLKNSMPKLNEIICTCYAWLWLDAFLTTMRCSALCVSGLVDDFTFWHWALAVSTWAPCCSSRSISCAPGAKSAGNCRFFCNESMSAIALFVGGDKPRHGRLVVRSHGRPN